MHEMRFTGLGVAACGDGGAVMHQLVADWARSKGLLVDFALASVRAPCQDTLATALYATHDTAQCCLDLCRSRPNVHLSANQSRVAPHQWLWPRAPCQCTMQSD